MAQGGVDLDELLDARARLNATRERGAAKRGDVAPDPDPEGELSITALLGLWVLLTVLIFVRVVVSIVNFLVAVSTKVSDDMKKKGAK